MGRLHHDAPQIGPVRAATCRKGTAHQLNINFTCDRYHHFTDGTSSPHKRPHHNMTLTTTRQEMIEQLVAFSMRAAFEDRDAPWLREMFERGFRGFGGLSHSELVREMQFRGLLGDDVPEGEADDIEDDVQDDTNGASLQGLFEEFAPSPLFAEGE
jgi:hypothetical protein